MLGINILVDEFFVVNFTKSDVKWIDECGVGLDEKMFFDSVAVVIHGSKKKEKKMKMVTFVFALLPGED